MRWLVFMSDNRPLNATIETADYNSLAACINYAYCARHGYDFIYYRPYLDDPRQRILHNCIDPNTGEQRHAAWSKVLSAQKALQLPYTHIIYVDSDCIFKDFNQTLDDFIENYADKDVIFLNDKPFAPDRPNSGVFICKNNSVSAHFLATWYNCNSPVHNRGHPWEQGALWTFYHDYPSVGIIDSWMFVEEEGQFFRHIYHGEGSLRIPYFRKFIENNSIDYSNIRQIPVIEFNTMAVTSYCTVV